MFHPLFRILIGFALALMLAGGAMAQQRPLAKGARADEPSFIPLPPPSLNFYGSAGLIDMPSAEMLPDGQFTTAISHFGGQTRFTMTFQALPWLSTSFRYNAIQNWNLGGFATYYDRGFDVRFRLLKEGRRWPGITLGLQDFVGTGIYAGEYIVATKNFTTRALGSSRLPGRLKLTAGLGWGRLGSHGSIASYGTRPVFNVNSTGGQVAYEQWFRGPISPFAGVEWRPNDRWGLKAEYSSDAYVIETTTTSVFQRKSSLNFGIEYQASARTRLGAYYLYGSELGLTAQIQLNPYYPRVPPTVAAPRPVMVRPALAEAPDAYDTGWAEAADAPLRLRDRLAPVLRDNGLVLEALEVRADWAELRFRNTRYDITPLAIGRAARAMARVMPASVETFRLIPVAGGLAAAAVTLRRSDLEALEFAPDSSNALLAVAGIGEASRQGEQAVRGVDLYPAFSWSLGPYFSPSYFDPDRPVRMDFGVEASAVFEPGPGWTVAGTLKHRLVGNIKDGRLSNSVLARVRTDQTLYAQSDTTMTNLFASYRWRPGKNLYARVTAGYLEKMFGGISAEVLWKPVNSRLALGTEINYVRQRDYDQGFGFRNYSVLTGHASAYLDMGGGFLGQVDVGRYLAGDVGATFSLDRAFDNGWTVGGFFTLTNVSARDFGEGSFDKGIRFTIPVSWFLGRNSRETVGTEIRPIQRDGGQRLRVPGRLYGQVLGQHGQALRGQWARVWE